MLDFSHLPPDQRPAVFIGQAASVWQVWNKPRGARFVVILAIGAGGNGGNGFASAAGVSAGGGGSGGSGATTKVMYPAALLPDRLFINGGLPGAPINIALAPIASASLTGNTATFVGNGGNGGNGATGGVAGGAGTQGAVSGGLGTMQNGGAVFASSTAGVVGAAGGTTGFGASSTTNPVLMHCPGSGGAGCNTTATAFRGGDMLSVGADELGRTASFALGGAGNAAGSGTKGDDGLIQLMPRLRFTGGLGGGNAFGAGAVGGAGGNGGYGCGGGGGGAASGAGAVGGAGGRGGPGLVLIWTF